MRYVAERDTPHGRRAVGRITCPDGWAAARLLLAASIEDARTAAARTIALELRAASPGDDDFVRAVFDYVRERVRFVREPGEVFARSDYTLAAGGGDCDDHARVVYALLAAGGAPVRLAFLFRRGDVGPRHVVAQAGIPGRGWVWLETTVEAELGEHPFAAAQRLGLVKQRSDIATEVRVMTEKDLANVPAGFALRVSADQLERDAVALEKLGFLCTASGVTSATDEEFRRALFQFQKAAGITTDGLIGPQSRKAIAARLTPDEFGLGYIGALQPRTFTHAQAREALRRAYVAKFGREPSSGELDFGQAVAWFETNYGRAGGQFARWAAEGKINWGAEQSGSPGEENNLKLFRSAGLHPVKERGADAGRATYFYLYPDDVEAAQSLLMTWGKPDTLAAAAAGDARGVAAAMRRHRYYEGFWVAPGQLGTNGRTAERGFREASSVEDAEEKNIAAYAGALASRVRIVTGAGGIPDPAPASVTSLLGSLVAGVLVAGAAAAGWWLAGRA